MSNPRGRPPIHRPVLPELSEKKRRYHIVPSEVLSYAEQHGIDINLTTVNKIFYGKIDKVTMDNQSKVLAIVNGIIADRQKTLCDMAVWKI